MKVLIRFASILAILGGFLLCFLGGEMKQDSQPQKVEMGIVTNGEYTHIDTGYMGGNSQLEEDGEWTNNLGVLFLVCGAVGLVGSLFVKQPSNEEG